MKTIWVPIAYAVATAAFWGLYGPTLTKSRGPWSPFKPYMFIGVAYLVWGVVGGLAGMKLLGDNWRFGGDQFLATKWGFIAGSLGAIAGLCDPTGRIFGLMPHPERFVDLLHHPRWTRLGVKAEGDGLRLFRDAVESLRA